jgi:hypothetical protein
MFVVIFSHADSADRADFNSPNKNHRFLRALVNFYAQCIKLKGYLCVEILLCLLGLKIFPTDRTNCTDVCGYFSRADFADNADFFAPKPKRFPKTC